MEFKYKIDNGEVTITGIKNWYAYPTIIDIPELIDGYPVTTLGNNAFISAFVTHLNLPKSINGIGYFTFSDCEKLTYINNIRVKYGVNVINDRFIYYDKGVSKIYYQISDDYCCNPPSGDKLYYFINNKFYYNLQIVSF